MLNEKVIGDYAFQLSEHHKVGTGQFSQVYKGYHLQTQQQVAIKQIDKKQVKGIFEQMVRNEINILRQLNHKYILKLHNFYETANNIYIITEYCETDVLQILKQQGTIPEDEVIIYVLQIAEALQYLRSQKIVHRDVKPSNILLHKGEVRLADFGFAIPQDLVTHEERKFQIGSPLYMSPETLMRNEYNHRTDLWALGVLYFEMIFGVVPFFSMELSDLVAKLKQYKQDYTLLFKHPISDGSTEAIRNLLAYDPSHRCDLSQLAMILQNYLRNRIQVAASTHSHKQQIKKVISTPESSPTAKTRLLSNKKELVKINSHAVQSDKKNSYFQKTKNEQPDQTTKPINHSQNLKKEGDPNTDRKENGVNGAQDDISFIREHQGLNGTINNAQPMGNEDFLRYFLEKLETLKGVDVVTNEKIEECQLELVKINVIFSINIMGRTQMCQTNQDSRKTAKDNDINIQIMQITEIQKRILVILGLVLLLLLILYFSDSMLVWQFGCLGHLLFIVGLFIIIKNVIRLFVFPGSFWLWRRNVENRYAKALAKRANKRMEDLSNLINKFLQASEYLKKKYDSVKQICAEDLVPIKKTLQSFTNTFSAMNYRKELNKQQKDLFNQCQQLEQNLKDFHLNDKSLYDYLDTPHELFNLTTQQLGVDVQLCTSILAILDNLMNQLQEIYIEKNIILSIERWIFNKTLGTIDQMRVELENTFKTKRIKVQGYDVKQIDCLFIYASEEEQEDPGPTVIFCQPNAGYYEYMYYESEWIDYYMKRGVNMFLWNYRGYCESEGMPNTQDILKDAEIICDFVTQQLKVTRLIIHGESLGGMIACHLGKVKPCTVLFADRTFASISKIAQVGFSKYASFFFNLLTSWDYNSARAFVDCENYKILALDCKDEVIPYLSSLKVEVGKQVLLKEFGAAVSNDENFRQSDSNDGFFQKISKFIPCFNKHSTMLFNEIWHSQILTRQELLTFYESNQRIQQIMRELQTERSKKTLDDSYSNYLNESQEFEKQFSQQNSIPAIENEEATQLQGSYVLSEKDKGSENLLKFVSKVYECFEAFESASMTLNDVFSMFNESQQYDVFMDYLLSIFFWGSYLPLKNISKKKMNTVVCQKLAFARFTTNINKIETLIKNEKHNLDSPVGERLIQDLELVISRFRLMRENFKKAVRSQSSLHSSIQIESTLKNAEEKKPSSKIDSFKHHLGAFIPLTCGHNGNLNSTEIDALDFHLAQAGILRF